MTAAQVPRFPCGGPPADGPASRLLGLYPQAQEGLWMQRVRVPGGRLAAGAWQALAGAAREFTPQAPLHLTTRQDVEFHDVPADRVAALQRALAAAGLTGLGACGDTLRNVTVCPCAGAAAGTVDLGPLAEDLGRLVAAEPGAFALPRKFKISLSMDGCACGRPWINDAAFVAARRDGAWTLRVVAAGSLGPHPRTGMLLFDGLPPRDAIPCALALVRLFAAHGDREHRVRARLRHVRERMGDERFAALAREALEAARAERAWPAPDLPDAPAALSGQVALAFADGDFSADQAEALGRLAARPDLRVRIALDHRVLVFGPGEAGVAAVAGETALAAARATGPVVVACPGRRWCKRGVVDIRPLAARLREVAVGCLPAEATVAISGCPNGCAASAVADVGLVGVLREGREAYRLLAGGGMGRDARLAEPVGRHLSPEDVAAWIAAHAAPHTA